MPIHGIFYARFLPQLGTKIVAQSPPGCIVPVAVADESDDEDAYHSHRRPQPQQHPYPSSSSSQLHRSTSSALVSAAANATGASTTSLAAGSATTGASANTGNTGNSPGHHHHSKPGNSSSASSSVGPSRGKPLFDFDVMQEYVIPRPAFFNRYFAAREPSGRYAVLGLPVAIRHSKYHRNEFIFNFGIVVDAEADQGPYERVVRRLASTFAEMEKQNEYLSQEERKGRRDDGGGGSSSADYGGTAGAGGSNIEAFLDRRRLAATGHHPSQPPRSRFHVGAAEKSTTTATAAATGHSPYHRRSIQSLLEIIKEDLNLYGECMIPVDDANTINMKLFPQHPDPPPVEGWHVPVPKMRLADAVDPSWDLTLQRVIAHMDGVSDVRRIAFEADISLELCRAALRHLLYYDTVLMLDMFFFSSCYAPRPGIHDFVANVGGIVDECARYVCLGNHYHYQYPNYDSHASGVGSSSAGNEGGGYHSYDDNIALGSFATVREQDHQKPHGGGGGGRGHTTSSTTTANTTAAQGQPSHGHAAHAHGSHLPHRPPRISNFDLIRLMVSFCAGRTVTEWLKGHADAGFDVLRYVDVRRLVQFGVIKGCLYRVQKYVVSKQYLAALVTGQAQPEPFADPLQKYTDGSHHFDQIITEQNLTEVEIIEKLRRLPLPPGDLKILHR